MTLKKRLDQLLVERKLAANLQSAQALIMAGKVLVNDGKIDKAGHSVNADSTLRLLESREYVGRGALKLKAALGYFAVILQDKVCADVGSSTGGFTEVMLENGARKVFAIDVGYGELDWKLRSDSRVTVMERTNARYLESLPEEPQFVSIDVSFISLKLILPVVSKWQRGDLDIIALIKPQFEAAKEEVGSGGVILNQAVHKRVISDITSWCAVNHLNPSEVIESPIEGMHGNKEFLIKLLKRAI